MRLLMHALGEHGHVRPILGLAQAAQAVGHDVLLVSEAKGCTAAASMGVDAVSAPEPDFVSDDDAYLRRVATFMHLDFPERVVGIQEMFRERAELCVPALLSAAESFAPDLVVRESTALGGTIAAELLDLPTVVFDWVGAAWRARSSFSRLREQWHLPPSETSTTPTRVLLGGPPGWFEPECLEDATLIRPPAPVESTDAWEDLPGEAGLPLVYVTIGTVSIKNEPDLLARVFEAVSTEPVRVVATAPGAVDRFRADVPDNVELYDFVPQTPLIASADAVIAHGGWGTIMTVLDHGVPMVCVPGRQSDNVLNAHRLARLGAGTVVPREEQSVGHIRRSLQQVLRSDDIRDTARAVARSFEQLAPLTDVVAGFEDVAAQR